MGIISKEDFQGYIRYLQADKNLVSYNLVMSVGRLNIGSMVYEERVEERGIDWPTGRYITDRCVCVGFEGDTFVYVKSRSVRENLETCWAFSHKQEWLETWPWRAK